VIQADPLLGTGLHAVGALCAALCYTPQQGIRSWSWQTYWLAQASICWLLAPVVGAFLTVPDLLTALGDAPPSALWKTFLLGAAYGIGGTAFGLAIRHIGYSLTYAMAVGLSCVLGTLSGPLIQEKVRETLEARGAGWVLAGIAVGAAGIFLCGVAGRRKEIDIGDEAARRGFSLSKGLPLCLIAGVLSAVYGIAVNDTGKPIAEAAGRHGAGHWETNAVYIFSNSGAFVTTAAYTIFLGIRHRTLGEFVRTAAGRGVLLPNYLLAILTGCLWYSQFLFYGIGHVRMGKFEFSSWAIHMILLILWSALTGLLMREWKGCRPRTLRGIALAIVVLIAAVLSITYGNWLARPPAPPPG
jgi:L-rhamnose-H+ transport protein